VSYGLLKFLHLLGVVMLIGNVTVTSFWKVFADRTGDPRLIAHAQHMVTVTDWAFTLPGILLLGIGGFGAAWVAGIDPFGGGWLVRAELLFAGSGAMWLLILVPLQIRLGRQARVFARGGPIPASYRRASRLWLVWGVAATIPLAAATYVMIAKD
jgi:uncharacterized membrane protein